MNKMDREEHLYTAFQFFDKDCSGYITRDELEQALKEKGICLRGSHVLRFTCRI
ncbi:hypothetical protein ZWY2020_008885, partial [Hordeum vulgare]